MRCDGPWYNASGILERRKRPEYIRSEVMTG